jgi:hypothetical protein
MNQTMVEKIQCMLSHSRLSEAFWGEALSYARHIIDRLPSTTLNGENPFGGMVRLSYK